jgi:hypothetical protein
VAKKNTGLGIDAFFPPLAEEPTEPTEVESKPSKKRSRPVSPKKKVASDRTQAKRVARSTASQRIDQEKGIPRRTAWLREDHLDRLEALKRKEKARLRADPNKRVAVSTLIDEAIERYLDEME